MIKQTTQCSCSSLSTCNHENLGIGIHLRATETKILLLIHDDTPDIRFLQRTVAINPFINTLLGRLVMSKTLLLQLLRNEPLSNGSDPRHVARQSADGIGFYTDKNCAHPI